MLKSPNVLQYSCGGEIMSIILGSRSASSKLMQMSNLLQDLLELCNWIIIDSTLDGERLEKGIALYEIGLTMENRTSRTHLQAT